MPVTVVLAVGLDPWLLAMKSSAWKSRGYVVISVATAREAIENFATGDFDLVLLGNTINAEKKEQLTRLIRTFSKRTPILCVSDSTVKQGSGHEAAPAVSESSSLFAGLKELLASEAGLLAQPFAV